MKKMIFVWIIFLGSALFCLASRYYQVERNSFVMGHIYEMGTGAAVPKLTVDVIFKGDCQGKLCADINLEDETSYGGRFFFVGDYELVFKAPNYKNLSVFVKVVNPDPNHPYIVLGNEYMERIK